MRAVLSQDAVTTRLPSPLNTALDTSSLWPFRTAISLPLFASQIRAVLSQDAVTTRLPSPLNAALDTSSLWPFRTAISLPLSASQMRAVLSSDAVTTRLPSPLNAALVTANECAPSRRCSRVESAPPASLPSNSVENGVIQGRRP